MIERRFNEIKIQIINAMDNAFDENDDGKTPVDKMKISVIAGRCEADLLCLECPQETLMIRRALSEIAQEFINALTEKRDQG